MFAYRTKCTGPRPDGEIIGEGMLDAGANRRAHQRLGLRGNHTRENADRNPVGVSRDIRKGDAASGVEQRAVPRVADTATNRSLPVTAKFEYVPRNEQSRKHAGNRFSPSPALRLAIAFDTKHNTAGLPITADLTAAHERAGVGASEIERACRRRA